MEVKRVHVSHPKVINRLKHAGGHLHNVIDTPGALFEAVVAQQGRLLVSGTAPPPGTSKRA